MATWNEALREAEFKRVTDGFVFNGPSGRYLVSEAQKAEIQSVMRPPHRWFLAAGIIWIGLGLYYLVAQNPIAADANIGLGICWLVGFTDMRPRLDPSDIEPILAGACSTERRITWRERNEITARMLPTWAPLVLGLICLTYAVISIGEAIAHLNNGFAVFLMLVMVGLSLFRAARFLHLVFIKLMLGWRV
jgi:hypothetical protein